MGKIRSVPNVTHPELWEKTDNNTHLLRNDDPARPRKKQTVGLRESERNLVHSLDNEIVTALETELGDDFLDEESTSQSNNDERNSAEVLLSLALKHEDITCCGTYWKIYVSLMKRNGITVLLKTSIRKY